MSNHLPLERPAVVLLLLMILTAICPAQQTLPIEGSVTDLLSGERLPGANVQIEGSALGAATDRNGKFILNAIPAGTHTFIVTYIGYETITEQIEIGASERQPLDFRLRPLIIEGNIIEVSAQAEGQLKAINQQLSAKAIVNHVSASRIEELPDANAAESVARLPGVSILREGGEGHKVIIRGLSPKYNLVTINGVRMASTDYDERSVDLSMIAPNMLEGIEVMKAITADQDADVLGGAVNFRLKEPVMAHGDVGTRRHIELQGQGGYNDLKSSYGNYKYTGMITDRFFNNRFGILLQAFIERRNLSSNELGAYYYLNGPELGIKNPTFIQRLNLSDILRDKQRFGGTLSTDLALSQGKISLTNLFCFSDSKIENRSEFYDLDSDMHLYRTTDSRTQLNTFTNILNYERSLSLIRINSKFSHSYSEKKTPDALSFYFFQQSVGLNEVNPRTNPNQIQNYSADDPLITYLSWIDEAGIKARERQLTAALDFETSISLTRHISNTFTWGGKYGYRNRDYNSDVTEGFFHKGGGQDTRQAILDAFPWMKETVPSGSSNLPIALFTDAKYKFNPFLDGEYTLGPAVDINLMRQVHQIVKTEGAAYQSYIRNDFTSTTHDYSGNENFAAGYLQTEIRFGPQITLMPGLRYEQLKTSYTGMRGNSSFTDSERKYNHYDTTMTRKHHFWLPMIHFKYKPMNWLDFRVAYTNTLTYPDYRSIIPRINVTNTRVYWNNPDLKPAQSENFDLYVSLYSHKLGLFTMGGFIKRIDDLIFYSSGKLIIDASAYEGLGRPEEEKILITNINNPYRVSVKGIEIEWQTHFWYLPGLLKGLVLNTNYTHIHSRAKYPRSILEVTHLYEPPWVIKTNVDSYYNNRLIDQPDDMFNVALGYDYKGFSARISLLYQDNIFKTENFWPELHQITDTYVRWDLSIKQDLPWYGLQIYGNVNNIFGERDSNLIQGSLFPATEQHYGRTADLGLRIKL